MVSFLLKFGNRHFPPFKILEGNAFIQLTTKDGLTKQFTDYSPKQISKYKIIAESRLSLRIDSKMVSFLLKFGNRHFPPFKIIVSYQLIIHVYSGIWKKKSIDILYCCFRS